MNQMLLDQFEKPHVSSYELGTWEVILTATYAALVVWYVLRCTGYCGGMTVSVMLADGDSCEPLNVGVEALLDQCVQLESHTRTLLPKQCSSACRQLFTAYL
jgi:hypothetical protein